MKSLLSALTMNASNDWLWPSIGLICFVAFFWWCVKSSRNPYVNVDSPRTPDEKFGGAEGEDYRARRTRNARSIERVVNGRRPWTKADKEAVYQAFGGRCFKCNAVEDLEYDHHVPFIRGGFLTRENATLLCSECNEKKAGYSPEQFYTAAELEARERIVSKIKEERTQGQVEKSEAAWHASIDRWESKIARSEDLRRKKINDQTSRRRGYDSHADELKKLRESHADELKELRKVKAMKDVKTELSTSVESIKEDRSSSLVDRTAVFLESDRLLLMKLYRSINNIRYQGTDLNVTAEDRVFSEGAYLKIQLSFKAGHESTLGGYDLSRVDRGILVDLADAGDMCLAVMKRSGLDLRNLPDGFFEAQARFRASLAVL